MIPFFGIYGILQLKKGASKTLSTRLAHSEDDLQGRAASDTQTTYPLGRMSSMMEVEEGKDAPKSDLPTLRADVLVRTVDDAATSFHNMELQLGVLRWKMKQWIVPLWMGP